ncbi:DUF2608 domain-containing protein [Thermomonas paludicola]|uniref:DUF2608 domain-containing protein n=1 Tax=Thermomonas paludicola TaxID=2884874 RepID=UPI00211399D3|nr:DUF2608 domain-containing protein [Thermomonas paludicola]
MRRLLPVLLLVLLGACSTPALRSGAASSTIRDIDDLAQLAPALNEGRGRTLLVLDIDDTLLTSDGFFGSDKWYEWQKRLPASDPGKVPCLFDVISMNYETGTQTPTQPDGPALINALAVDKLLLTSRNPLYRGGTLRTLQAAGYALPAMLGGQVEGRSWDFRKAADAKPVRVFYDQGLFMTTGQDKGLALLNLLQGLHLRYDRVVLVDDGQKNIDNMRAALQVAHIDYLGLHYTRVNKGIGSDDATAGRAGWQAWRQLLASAYPKRLADLENGKCFY